MDDTQATASDARSMLAFEPGRDGWRVKVEGENHPGGNRIERRVGERRRCAYFSLKDTHQHGLSVPLNVHR